MPKFAANKLQFYRNNLLSSFFSEKIDAVNNRKELIDVYCFSVVTDMIY